VAEFPFTPDTKGELLLVAVVDRLDALLAALTPEPLAAPEPPPPARKRTPKQPPKEA